MSSIVDSVKDTITGATSQEQQGFPKPDAFKAETQVDRNVGIEADIEGPKPIATKLEGDYGLERCVCQPAPTCCALNLN